MKTKLKKLSKRTISVVLTLVMLVSMAVVAFVTANALDTYSYDKDSKIYFDVSSFKSNWESSSKVYFALLFQKGDNSTAHAQRYIMEMTRISDTDIYYLDLSGHYTDWYSSGGTGVCFFSGSGWTTDEGQSTGTYDDIATWADNYTYAWGTNIEDNHVYYWRVNSSTTHAVTRGGNSTTNNLCGMDQDLNNSSGQTINNSNVTVWKYNQTIGSATKGAADSNYSSSNTGGSVVMTAYSWSGASAVTANSNVNTSTNSTATFNNAAKTTTVTLTATPQQGYRFVGFYDELNGGTELTSTINQTTGVGTATYTVSSAKTYYARFEQTEDTYTVTAKSGANGKISVNGGDATTADTDVRVGAQYTTATIEAIPNTGYAFSNWTTTGGASYTGENPITVTATADGTITANFTEKATRDISVDVDDHVSVTVSGSSVAGENKTFTSDGTFTAHVDDVISFSAAGQTSDYTYDTLEYTTDGSSYTSGTFFTVAAGTYGIRATSKEKNGYYFYVSAGTGAQATVKIGSGSNQTVATGTRQKFYVDDESTNATVTSAVSNSSTYENPAITLVATDIEHGSSVASPATVTKDNNGATYYVTASTKGGTDSAFYFWYATGTNHESLTKQGKMKYVNGSSGAVYYDIDVQAGNTVCAFSQSDSAWSSYNTKVMTDPDSITDNIERKDNSSRTYNLVSFKSAGKVRFVYESTTSAYVTTASGSGDITTFDTYYLGGRFRIKDGDTGQYVFTDADEGSWQTYSVKMPFTLTGTNEYTLNTNQTIGQLSAQLDGKLPYFIVHDKKTAYHTSGTSVGLNFEEQKGSGNALTLSSGTGLTYENELLFSDTENNSDGIVTIHYNSSDKTIWYTVANETAPVASSVTLAAKYNNTSVATTTAGNTVTLEATVTTPHANAGTMTYTFYNETTGQQIGEPVQTSETTASVTFTEGTVRTDTFKVVVSSAGTDSSTDKTLRDIWSRRVVKYTNPSLYRTNVDLAGSTTALVNSSNWYSTAIADSTDHTFNVTLAAGKKYEFAIATAKPTGNADYTTLENNLTSDFYIDEKHTKYCDVSYTTLSVSYENGEDTEQYTVRTYTVVPRTNCANPTIHINTNAVAVKNANGETVYYPGSIYAVATYSGGQTNTKDETETVTYYFAEAVDTTDKSYTGDGVRIAYWNNSLEAGDLSASTITTNATKVDVTTAVNVSGSNQIYVDMTKLYNSGDTSTSRTFKVYSVELPVWATSFTFLDTSDNPISTRSIKKEWGAYDYGSLLLNPNRVYLLYKDDGSAGSTNYYTKGVVLDKGLWSSTTKNSVDTKTFKANAINYNTTYNENSVSNGFNTWLSERAYNNYANGKALYFGYTTDVSGYKAGTLANNLAMRKQPENDFFASIQDLVAEKLDTDNVNSNGFPILEAYTDTAKHNKINMPLFDYEALAEDKSSQTNSLIDRQYTGVNFPMYESEFNGITTYSFDSSTDPNRTISNGDFVIDNAWRIANDDLGYKPFISDSNCNADKNYGNATELDVEFYMSNTGSLKDSNGKNHDITFNFTGDDDVWVYVDGVLVLDLGGAHKASAGSINFTDMKVYYKTAADSSDNTHDVNKDTWPHEPGYVNTINLQALLEANGVNFNNKDGNTKHTFQMFYMERGAIDSNMSVSFNLPQASGLNINNQVTANNVNMGLKEAALYAANSDYFTYGVSAALNSGSLYSNTTAAYAGASNNTAAQSAATAQKGPNYPMSTNTNRVYSTTVAQDGAYVDLKAVYPLSRTTSSSSEGAQYSQTTTFTGLNGVTYSLSDKYLVSATSDEDVDLEVTGKTSGSGEFNLLGSQTATFEDKITPHSFVKVYQKNALGKVNTSVTPIGYSTVNDNYTNNYYITSYSIYDDHSSTWIKPKTDAIVSTGADNDLYAADNSANSQMFYFSDYGKTGNSAAMTVTFYNDIAVGDIRISKDYNGDDSTTFYYDVKFANIFGSDDAALTNLVAYNHITYDVIETSTGALVAKDRPYGTTGIALKKGQTAVITGVPVETRYQVTERAKSGTMLNSIAKSVKGPDGAALETPTPLHGYAESFTNEQITDLNIRGTSNASVEVNGDTYYVNMIPIIQESYKNGAYKTTSYVAFENLKTSIKIRFNYYDRKLTNGEPATISNNATQYTVNSSLSDDLEDDNAKIKEALASLIGGAAVEFQAQALSQNVVDDYVMWTSEEDASNGIGNLINIATGSKYSTENQFERSKVFHTNSSSQLFIGTELDAASYAERWVNYKAGDTYVEAEQFTTAEEALAITEINVWLFNTPHTYKVNVYGAKTLSDMSAATTATLNNKTMNIRVANEGTTTSKLTDKYVYYNQRLGEKLNEDNIDTSGYIGLYHQLGYRADIEPINYITNATLTDNGKNYRFAYWAYDPAGQIVASRDAYYYYRVTRDTDLYAVYAETQLQEKVDVGLTIYNNRNDVYVDASGVSRTRMNVVINPYALTDSDVSLQQTALVYVNLSKIVSSWDNTDIMALFNLYKDQLDDILNEKAADAFNSVNTISTADPFNLNGKSVTDVTLTTKGFVRNAVHTGDGFTQTKTTAKNRVQYTLSIKTSTLKADTKLMFVGAMYYNGYYETKVNHWITSDNCLIYENGNCKELDFGRS